MRNVAALFLFGVALVTLAGSYGGEPKAKKQVQFVPQEMKIINLTAGGPYVPVLNDKDHPIYVIQESAAAPTAAPVYEYTVETFTPPLVATAQDTVQKVDSVKAASSLNSLLNSHADWEVVSVPTTFTVGANVVVFKHRKS